ncbi:MAG: segregation/condensation protein A [Enterococcus sp.]
MKEINIKLDIFEGPLDLLLHLIQKWEIDIYDIPIAKVTQQYMNYIHAMKKLELEVAGEYLVMAATLMAIKSQMLLPKPEIEVEEEFFEEDPREELVSQLLEYRKFKYAAEILSEKAQERSQYFSKDPMNVESYREKPAQLAVDKFNKVDLYLAFHSMLNKKKQRQVLETTIAGDENTIEEKMTEIQTKLTHLPQRKSGYLLEEFFTTYSKNEMVTVFMAILELMKNGKIKVEQESNCADILLYAVGEQADGKN